MRPFFPALLCIAFVLVSPARAQNPQECESYPDVPVTVNPVFENPKYDFSQDIAAIQTMAKDSQRSISEKLTLGLTRYEPMLEFRLPMKGVIFPNGLACAHAERAEITIGYRNVTVYVAREVPQGSCGFGEIMAHEQKHIDVNKQLLQDYAPMIQEKLRAYLRLNGVFRERNPDYAMQLLREKLQEIVNSLGLQMMEDNHRRQQQVDNMDEYQRITLSCNGQMASIAEHFRMTGH
ncbi:MAG: hypothetical protein SFW62_07315 [Alphaproteobacteria bacterium]|nr:hypothetical protein [Alphaproteobacteria bacterium]